MKHWDEKRKPSQIVVEELLGNISNILNCLLTLNPNLVESDEHERHIIVCRAAAKDAGIQEGNRDMIYEFVVNRVRKNLHIVLVTSLVGSAFRTRCQMFSSFVNCCTIDWFTEWPREAFLSVSQSVVQSIVLGSVEPWSNIQVELKVKFAEMRMEIHTSWSEMAERFYRYYTTPTIYLEPIMRYFLMLGDEIIQRVQATLPEFTDCMKIELTAFEPELLQKSENTVFMGTVVYDQANADEVAKIVKGDEAIDKDSLRQLQTAIKCFVVMSEELAMIYNSFLGKSASDSAYPSLMPLASWAKDIIRTIFVHSWINVLLTQFGSSATSFHKTTRLTSSSPPTTVDQVNESNMSS